MPFRGFGNGSQGVEFCARAEQVLQAGDYFPEGWGASLAAAICVVYVLRAVDGESDEEILRSEKICPFRGYECAVCLESVVHDLAVSIFFLESDGFPVEIQACHQRLAAVPVECDFRGFTGGDIIAYHTFQQFF